MIKFTHRGNFNRTKKFLNNAINLNVLSILNAYGKKGVNALSSATPVDTGLTSSSWEYEISTKNNEYIITWSNSNVVDGVPIAIILQYGHGTGNGGYVEGRDYINPSIQPIFDELAIKLWEEVTKV